MRRRRVRTDCLYPATRSCRAGSGGDTNVAATRRCSRAGMGGICVAARRRYRTRTGGDDFSRSICGFSARLSVSRAFIRRLNADRFNVGLGRSVRRGALPAIIAKWSSKLLIRLIGLFYISSGNGHHSLRRSIGYCKFKKKGVIFLERVVLGN